MVYAGGELILAGCCCCCDSDLDEESDGVLGLTGISGAGVFGNGGGMLDSEPLSSVKIQMIA